MNETIQTAAPKRFQCRHIHTEGRRCGSASLRGEEFCYFHHTSRKPVSNPRSRRTRQSTFDLPLPEDRGAIQISLGEVLRRIASNAIDPRRAGLLLYGLQIAALNLPPHKPANTRREGESPVIEEIVTDPTHGEVAPALELPDPDAPRENSLTALLLKELRMGREEMEAEFRAKIAAEQQSAPAPIPEPVPEPEPAPTTLPTLNATASDATPTPGAPFMTVSPSWVGSHGSHQTPHQRIAGCPSEAEQPAPLPALTSVQRQRYNRCCGPYRRRARADRPFAAEARAQARVAQGPGAHGRNLPQPEKARA